MKRLLEISHRAVEFWRDAGAKAWFQKSDEFDAKLEKLFADDLIFLETQDLPKIFTNSTAPYDVLGLIICLDQFRRNLNRGSGKAFAFDHQALALSQHLVKNNLHLQIDEDVRMFSYMPYMHSEVLAVQAQAVELFDHLEIAVVHYDLIKEYGRFPHRNECLNRTSTPEELAYLETDGFKG